MTPSEAPERRREPRRDVRWPATWWLWEKTGSEAIDEGEILDVGAGGIFLVPYSASAYPLKTGTRIGVSFGTATSGERLELYGTVRWAGLHRGQRAGVGVQFEERVEQLRTVAR